jgi:hypothetical protein
MNDFEGIIMSPLRGLLNLKGSVIAIIMPSLRDFDMVVKEENNLCEPPYDLRVSQ